MATTETFVPGRLYDMPLADLQQDPNQPRKYLDPTALDELTASVREYRVIAPILFYKLPQAVRDECRKDPSVPTS